jgi:hypothetical protein
MSDRLKPWLFGIVYVVLASVIVLRFFRFLLANEVVQVALVVLALAAVYVFVRRNNPDLWLFGGRSKR